MVLEYDFDIVTITAEEADPSLDRSNQPQGRIVRALFRDVKTADALRAASPKIRKIFQEAGFSLESTGSEVRHGFYRPQDRAERDRILRALFANIKAMGLKGEYCGEFDFWQFLDDVKRAKPRPSLRRESTDRALQESAPAAQKPNRRSVQGRVGFALGLAVILFVLIRFLVEWGATP